MDWLWPSTLSETSTLLSPRETDTGTLRPEAPEFIPQNHFLESQEDLPNLPDCRRHRLLNHSQNQMVMGSYYSMDYRSQEGLGASSRKKQHLSKLLVELHSLLLKRHEGEYILRAGPSCSGAGAARVSLQHHGERVLKSVGLHHHHREFCTALPLSGRTG